MTILTVFVLIAIAGTLGFLGVAFMAGAAATKTAFDAALDDLEQEQAIKDWILEKEKKKRGSCD